MRALVVAAAALWAGCETDACRGVDGTCVALTVAGQGNVDGLKIALSGAASGTRIAPQNAAIQSLPVEVALQLQSASNGVLHIDVTGVLLGGEVGTGSVDVTLSAGGHGIASVTLSADGIVGAPDDGGVFGNDLSQPPDLGPATSCKDVLKRMPGAATGWYDVTLSGTTASMQVLCDMDTAGGGWTLCAWSKDASAAATTWPAMAMAQTTNWYACHKYSSSPVEALVHVSNGSSAYWNQYSGVDFRPTAPLTAYVPSVAKAPNFKLTVMPNTAACGATSTGNFQWSVDTMGTIYGLMPQNSCSSGTAVIFIGATGANTNGCWGNNQISPQIGYPCGGYGNFSVHLELWAR